LKLGSFEVFEPLTMKEDIWILDTWLWQALIPSCITNDLLLVPKRPIKGWHPCKLGFYFCKNEILNELFNITFLRGKD
jgi:hypothetical protein